MNYIKSAVCKLVKRYSTKDPYELALAMDIKIIVDKMPMSIKGFYSNVMNMGFIYLNCELDELERRIVCAHELGHATLHPCSNSLFLSRNTFFLPSKLELQADKFAAELLLSDDLLLEISNDDSTIEQLAARVNLPVWMFELKKSCVN